MIKYIFPSSPSTTWYGSYKNGYGLEEECAYNLTSIASSVNLVGDLIDLEMSSS